MTEPHASTIPVRPGLIFLALVLGLAGGTGLAELRPAAAAAVVPIAQAVGKLWLNGLTMTVVPLVFGLLVVGIGNLTEATASGGIARRAIFWFVALLVSGCVASMLVVTGVLAAFPVTVSAADFGHAGDVALPASPTDWFSNVLPANPFKAAADMAVLPMVVFALLFGIAVSKIEPRLRTAVVTLFEAIARAMLVIVSWVLWAAPLGVFALAVAVGARLGTTVLGALIHYVVVVAIGCLTTAAVASVAAIVVGRISPARFFRATLPAQAVAVSTQSSLATLPAMLDAARGLGVSVNGAGIVLPLAVALFRAASAAANIAVGIYLAHVHGVELTAMTVAVGLATAVAVSLAAVGLPAQVNFFATIAPVCLAMGVPITLLPILLAIETIPDIFRTLGNVTADLAATRLACRGEVADAEAVTG